METGEKEIKENHLTTTITHTYGLENDIITELSDCKDLIYLVQNATILKVQSKCYLLY